MGWKRIKLLMPAPYMEYKSWRNTALLVQVGLIPSQQGWERRRRQPAPSAVVRWEGLERGLAQLASPGLLVKLPIR